MAISVALLKSSRSPFAYPLAHGTNYFIKKEKEKIVTPHGMQQQALSSERLQYINA